ncbi:MAG: hypothetical protein JWP11_3693 [Frankiales bacterium]|nr:hypothetical protein [Frankiales bacterium]
MTPTALAALASRALGRIPTRDELADWGRVLQRVPDDIGDQALLDHRAASTYPPTLADVRRHATALLNDRAMRGEAEQRRVERQTGCTADGQPLVPMPPAVREAAAQLAARQSARDAALTGQSQPTSSPSPTVRPSAPCCPHCPDSPHPPHRTACDGCLSSPMTSDTHSAQEPTR